MVALCLEAGGCIGAGAAGPVLGVEPWAGAPVCSFAILVEGRALLCPVEPAGARFLT